MSARPTSENESGSPEEIWPTPTVCGNYNRKGSSAKSGDGLATAVMTWPTPTARDYRSDSGSPEWTEMRQSQTRGKPLPFVVGGTLNPTWVEWLMGWPLGWTDLKPLGTGKSRNALPKHGDFSHKKVFSN